MLTPTWFCLVTQTLNRLESTDTSRVAVLGIGNELSGDDGAGVKITEGLKSYQKDPATRESTATRLIISAGLAPENFTGQLRRFRPDMVILIDAADLGSAPGKVVWLSWKDTVGMSWSTHSLPLSILAQYLVAEIGCGVYLLGIQVSSNGFGEALTLPVVEAVDDVVQGLGAILFPRV